MDKIYVQNLEMIVTEKCNLNCGHCLRGGCSNNYMSDRVIRATLDQISEVGCLIINGGEPLLALDRLEFILAYIIKQNIRVNSLSLIINGTIYSVEFLKILAYFEKYINSHKCFNGCASFAISWDRFHHDEIERLNMKELYLENIEKYMESEHFGGFQYLGNKVLREGYAENFDSNLTTPLQPMRPSVTYIKDNRFDKKYGVCNIGPVVAINANGTITECDASYENQESKYNYGNVLVNRISDVWLARNALVLKPRKWAKRNYKEIKKYLALND